MAFFDAHVFPRLDSSASGMPVFENVRRRKIFSDTMDNRLKTAQNSVKNGTFCEFLEIKHPHFSSSSFTFILTAWKKNLEFSPEIKSAVLGRSRL